MATAAAHLDTEYPSTLADDFRVGLVWPSFDAPLPNSLVSDVVHVDPNVTMLAGPTYGAFLEDLEALCEEAKDEDDLPVDEVVRQYAQTLAMETLAQLPSRWFAPRLATDSSGGIRMTWARSGSEVRAVVPANPGRVRYLYIETAGVHRSIPNFNPITLANELTRLV